MVERQQRRDTEAEIGYILKGFARTSETFITNEILRLEKLGLKLRIFSLLELTGQQRHAAVDAIQARVHYLPQLTPLGETNSIQWLAQNAPLFLRSHWRLFTARPRPYAKMVWEAIGFSFKYRARGRWWPKVSFIKEFLQAGFIAERVLASRNIRHLHAHFCHTATTVTMFASRLCGLPFSFTAHAKDLYVAEYNPGDLLPTKMRRAKFIVTCTAANRRHLEELARDSSPIHTIYHGLDLRQFAPRAMAPLPTTPLVLSVGRLVEKKGFTYLVEACRLLKNRGHDIHCQIVGSGGTCVEQVSSLIKALDLEDTISIRPAVTQEELQQIYRQATLFVLPCQIAENGDRDGIPNVLAEAMAIGLPVISTHISGIPELIDHNVNGLLVPQKDVDALADAMAELLEHPILCRQFSMAAREKVRRSFNAEESIRVLHRLFRSCLGETELTSQTPVDLGSPAHP